MLDDDRTWCITGRADSSLASKCTGWRETMREDERESGTDVGGKTRKIG